MNIPQAGIFALGTASHAYLEFDVLDQRHGAKLVATISALREPRTTIGGVNLVVGFRPELWSQVAPDHGVNVPKWAEREDVLFLAPFPTA